MLFNRHTTGRQHTGASRKQERKFPVRAFVAGVAGIALLVLTGWSLQHLSDPEVLPLRSVQVEGRFDHVTSEQLKQVVAPLITGGFFHVDVDAIRAAADSLPWVKNTSVRRVWPDTVKIKVTEQTAYARWNKTALVNAEGELFTPAASTMPANLPLLTGPHDSQLQLVQQLANMNALLQPLGLKIKHMVLNDRRSWQLTLDNGVEVVLGRRHGMQRIQRFIQVYPARLASEVTRIRRVDMRYNNGFAVHWANPGASGKSLTTDNHA